MKTMTNRYTHANVLDMLTPVLPSARERRVMQPERRLMLAILEDAARIYDEPEGLPDSVPRREVDEWFASDDRTWPFSFRNVCRVLRLDADDVRGRVAGFGQLRAA
jgi:hypothetical protein